MIENIGTSWIIIGLLIVVIALALKSIRKTIGRILIVFGIIAWFARVIDSVIAVILVVIGLILSYI
jgi:hypothetical protein